MSQGCTGNIEKDGEWEEREVQAINTNVNAQFDIMMFEYIAVVLKPSF